MIFAMSEIKIRVDLTFTVEDEIALRDEAFVSVATTERPPGSWSAVPQHELAGMMNARADNALTQLLSPRLMQMLTAFAKETPGLGSEFSMLISPTA